MLILGFAATIYIYFLFLGFGFARLALPPALIPYRTWLAPWLGLSIAAVLLVWFSRLGVDIANAIYPVTIVGVVFAGWSVLRGHRSPLDRSNLRLPLVVAFLITLLLALYPLLIISNVPTTISFGNFTDPPWYAATADFLRHGSIGHLPPVDVQRPITVQLNGLWQRPGSNLLIGFCGQLFHLPAYRVFFVLLAVMAAATTPLVGIFVRAVGGGLAAALLALTLSAFNVNQLYYLYNGFAGQVFCQGCLVTAFILLCKAEEDREHWASYAWMIGLMMCAMFDIYAEGAAAFVIPYCVYMSCQLFLSGGSKWQLIRRYSLPVGIALALDPFAFRNSLVVLHWRAGVISGWSMPRWALPVDMVGLMEPFSWNIGPAAYHSEALAAVASLPIVYFAVSGCRAWGNSRLTLSIALVGAGLLAYNCGVRHFSYGYHKVAAIFAFFLIGAFATGVSRALERYTRPSVQRYAFAVALALATAGSFAAASPFVEMMSVYALVVTPDMAELAKIRSIAGGHSIHILGGGPWDQAWGAQFLDPVRVHLDDPTVFGMPQIEQSEPWRETGQRHPIGPRSMTPGASSCASSKPEDELTLATSGSSASELARLGNQRILWKNQSYLLLDSRAPGDQVPHMVSPTKADIDRLAASPKEREAEREFQRLLTQKRRTHSAHD